MTTPDPLARKLQIKPDSRLLLLGAPDGFAAALEPLPERVTVATAARGQFDVVHLFVRQAKDLEKDAPRWIEEAKTAATRARRVEKSTEMVAAGVKDRNEKYRR
ncbi:hypothetical protein BE17_00750 [Sorangium cellulosum]|uniref:Uncharacterized protein n=1 Tax=Sorangium cellulosum TaxID=56 RepID=A0A150T6D0_SORCE|nr:hypothetical protein BE17_00750 [Sorangium cellulosum]